MFKWLTSDNGDAIADMRSATGLTYKSGPKSYKAGEVIPGPSPRNSDDASAAMVLEGLDALPAEKMLNTLAVAIRERADIEPAALLRWADEIGRYAHMEARD